MLTYQTERGIKLIIILLNIIILIIVLVLTQSISIAQEATNIPSLQYHQVFRLSRGTNSLNAIAWSPDGKKLIDSDLNMWDTDTGRWLMALSNDGREFHSVAWSLDGNLIAGGAEDNTVRIWDANTGVMLHILYGHGRTVYPGEGNSTGVSSVAWSPNDNRIASGGFDGLVRIWEQSDSEWEIINTFEGNGGPVTAVAWNPDGSQIAAANGAIQIWDPASGEKLATFRCNRLCFAVSWSPDGTLLAGDGEFSESGGAISIWNLTTEEQLAPLIVHGPRVNYVTWSPDGNRLAASQDEVVRVLDLSSGETLAIFELQTDIMALVWSPTGTQIAVGDTEGNITLWAEE